MNDADRISQAVAVARRYGGIDGAHHKQWVIDQMLRVLLCEQEYARLFLDTRGPNGEPDYYAPWDAGIAP
ncbi:MAG TPA: hypothetical protein VM529_12915 [Gemmata sp.]|jgi:hypothetical protein|nr:hypothetical protein [Gemmata sp.]